MDDEECHHTEKWDRHDTEIINIDSSTRICSCTAKRIFYSHLADNSWLLKNVVKCFEQYTRNTNSVDIGENRTTFCIESYNRKWNYWKHHDTSPPTELTWKERIRSIKPGTSDIFIHWISKIWEIERWTHRHNRLKKNTRQYPISTVFIGLSERKSLKTNVEKNQYNDNNICINSKLVWNGHKKRKRESQRVTKKREFFS